MYTGTLADNLLRSSYGLWPSVAFEHPFSYPQALLEVLRGDSVVFEHQYIRFIASSLPWWDVSFAPLGSLDRVCQVLILSLTAVANRYFRR